MATVGTLIELPSVIRRERRGMLTSGVVLHYGNALPHTSYVYLLEELLEVTAPQKYLELMEIAET
jgi:hypothetical protein